MLRPAQILGAMQPVRPARSPKALHFCDYSVPRNTYRRRNNTLSTQISGLISRYRPVHSLRNVNESNPRLNPVAKLNVSGVAISVRNAGTASVKSSHLTLATAPHISAPTKISAGAVAYDGIAATIGAQNIATTNNAAIARLPSPVRAPAATPAALSM